MKKMIIAIMLVFCAATVRAENMNISTSQYYVDTNAATRQDAVPANNANSVMTYDSVSSDGIGAKAIYDTTATYGEQKSALVTAATANTAIQNGINSEFVCANPPKCNLWNLAGIFQQDNPTPQSASRNLFNIKNAKVLYRNGSIQETKTETGFLLTNSNTAANFIVVEIGDISDFIDKTIRLSYTTTCSNDTGFVYCDEQGYNRALNVAIRTILVTEPENNQTKLGIRLYANPNPSIDCEYSNIQVEYGDTATEYEPYQNLYVPQNQQ